MQKSDFPLITVYADESGKTGNALIVGSVWILHPPEELTLFRTIDAWKVDHSFQGEFHFEKVSKGNLDLYCAFADFIAERSAVLGFKAISLDREGTGNVDRTLARLYYLLLTEGVEHENKTSRAPLPRALSLWKDQEESSRDKLFLAELRDRLKQAAVTRFRDELEIDQLEVVDSASDPFIQLADLFTSSLNRTLNGDPTKVGAKDKFANYFLERIGMSREHEKPLRDDDVVAHIRL